MKKIFKKYVFACGVLFNIVLLAVSVKGAAHVGSRVSNLGELFHYSAEWVKPYSASSAQLLLSLSERVTTQHAFEQHFTPRNWPNIGPAANSDPLPPSSMITVSTSQGLLSALRDVLPGQTIVIENGRYELKGKRFNISSKTASASAPIRVMAATRGQVTLALNSREGIVINQPHWQIEGIQFIGACEQHSQCDHALHIVGDADYTQVAHNTFYDFNAAIKINQQDANYPDNGLINNNVFGATSPRNTHLSVTPINLDHGSDWVIKKNIIHDFIKLGGNRVSYGAYMKGGIQGGVFEQNLVICNTGKESYPGSQVGLSFGGGGMQKDHRRDKADYEVTEAVMRNNLILHCNDVGIYSQRASSVTINNNTLYNTAGIDVRFPISSATVYNNILNGRIKPRDAAHIDTINNLVSPASFLRQSNALNAIFTAPQNGVFSVINPDALFDYALEAKPTTQTVYDFCGNRVHQGTAYIGAIYQDKACFSAN
ncbi:right-handed parallel beta-helix repeat-containing protein [Photobacterium japonica]|uniref:hypothetical protein n=1 Tax=Photobacterium japonica TaxID=2910235 RepID=UPI003D0E1731